MQRRVQPGGVRARGDQHARRPRRSPAVGARTPATRAPSSSTAGRGGPRRTARRPARPRSRSAAEQHPVVHGQVVGHRQPAADVRAERRAPAGAARGRSAARRRGRAGPGARRARPARRGRRSRWRRRRALGAQPGGPAGGRGQLGGERGPAAHRRRRRASSSSSSPGHASVTGASMPPATQDAPGRGRRVEHRDRAARLRGPPGAGQADHAGADHQSTLRLVHHLAPCAGMTRIRFDGRDLSDPLSARASGLPCVTCGSPYAPTGRSRRVGGRARTRRDAAARPPRRRPPLPLHRRPPRPRRPRRVRRRGARRRRRHHPAAGQGPRRRRWRPATSWPRSRCWRRPAPGTARCSP